MNAQIAKVPHSKSLVDLWRDANSTVNGAWKSAAVFGAVGAATLEPVAGIVANHNIGATFSGPLLLMTCAVSTAFTVSSLRTMIRGLSERDKISTEIISSRIALHKLRR